MSTWYPPKALPEPHPTLGCRHTEGAIVDAGRILRWLPGVHDCAYVDAVNAGRPPKRVAVRPIGR